MAPRTPTLLNLPPPPSAPDTPSEMPGTPTSTTTSLSALSTTAIKNGSRGDAHAHPNHRGGHHQHTSQNSLEAERADRISRLAGLSSISQQRPSPGAGSQAPANDSTSPQTTPTSVSFPQAVAPQILAVPAYFDSNGQPTAITKMSTSGTASGTASDIDMMSTDTNFGRETEADSTSGYIGAAASAMDTDDDNLTNRSVGGQDQFDDNMSDDDGSASLVGFGEGANSTYSGPIYVRRPLPGGSGLERAGSSLSERVNAARIMDGVNSRGGSVTADEEGTGDVTAGGPGALGSGAFQPGHTSSLRETQHGVHTRHHWNHQQPPTAREAAERVMRERGLHSDSRSGMSPVASPSKKLAFEDQK